MGWTLDSIIKRKIFDGPETINSTWTSDYWDLDDREGEFSLQVSYINGASVNIVIKLEVSNDLVNWAVFEDSDNALTDNDASVLYDIAGTGLSFMRVKIDVNSGSFDLQDIIYVAKRRH